MGDGGGGHWLVWMDWHPARWSMCLPLLILPCTIKSRSCLLVPSDPGAPGKRAVKRLWSWMTFDVVGSDSWVSNNTSEGIVCFADVRWDSSHRSTVSTVARNLRGLTSLTVCLAPHIHFMQQRIFCFCFLCGHRYILVGLCTVYILNQLVYLWWFLHSCLRQTLATVGLSVCSASSDIVLKVVHQFGIFSPKHFWATVCKTVRRMLSVRCLSVCPFLSCPVLSCLFCLWRSYTVAKRLDGSRRNLACR